MLTLYEVPPLTQKVRIALREKYSIHCQSVWHQELIPKLGDADSSRRTSYDRAGAIILNPDDEVQARLHLVFAKFQELQSARGVMRYTAVNWQTFVPPSGWCLLRR